MDCNPLDPVMETYKVSIECFKIAQRAVKQEQSHLFAELDLLIQPEAQQYLAKTKAEVNDLFVFSLWANFERFVITYLQNKGAGLQKTVIPRVLAEPLYEHFQKEVEHWNQREILDLLKKISSIDKNIIGQAKQILDYRNWIAHGKDVKKQAVVNSMTPAYTYRVLDEIIKILLLN
jgi:hypothetical protein